MNKLMGLKGVRSALLAATMICAAATPAMAEDGSLLSGLEVSGNAGLYSDYRFRGISFSDEKLAAQGGIDLAHSSGFYVGGWASSLAGWGSFGGSNVELDLYGGFGGEFAGGSYDIGLLWYMYPGTTGTDYAEIYASVSGALGPVEGTLGAAYAPDQSSIGSADNLYVYGDLGYGIPNTPVSLTAHLGYSDGSLAPTGSYLDWSVGADIAIGEKLTLGVAYVDTDLKNIESLTLLDPTKNIADGTVVVSLGVSF